MRKNKRKLCGFETTNRAKHNLKVHLILVCKYRKKLLVGEMLQHIPRISISSIVNRIKSITAHRIWEKHGNYLQKQYWKEKTFLE